MDEIAGYYIAQLCNALAIMMAPRRILLAGATIEDARARGGTLLDNICEDFARRTETYPHFGDPRKYIDRAGFDAAKASWRGALLAAMNAKSDMER
ncbi:MAG: hypothetical protein ACJ8AI_08845 [Rhodopila sp.]